MAACLATSLAGLAIRQPRQRKYHSGTPALADTALGNISHKMATPAARTKGTPHDPGHAPQIRVLRKVHGKSVAETLSSPAAFRKAQGEVSEFHRFQELSAELVTINEKICRLRPLEQEPEGWTAQEKKQLLRSIRKSRGK